MGIVASSLDERVQSLRRAVLARHGFLPGVATPRTPLDSPIEEAARLATVNAHWGIVSDTPLIGPIVVLVRRAMRIALRWYINPIVEQQNAFNDAALRALIDLRAENENLRTELARKSQTLSGIDPSTR